MCLAFCCFGSIWRERMLLNHHSFHKQVKIFLFFTFWERHIFCPYAFACQYRMKLAKQMSNILAIVDMIQIVGSEVTLPLMASKCIHCRAVVP